MPTLDEIRAAIEDGTFEQFRAKYAELLDRRI